MKTQIRVEGKWAWRQHPAFYGLVCTLSLLLFLPSLGWADDEGDSSATQQNASGPPNQQTPVIWVSVGLGPSYYNGDYAQLYQSGNFGYGLSGYALTHVSDSPVYVGADVGTSFWPAFQSLNPGDGLTLSAVSIHVLPMIAYRFPIVTRYHLSPFFGFAAGPNFYLFQSRRFDRTAQQIYTKTVTSVYFEFLLCPGLEVALGDGFAVGFIPQVGMLDTDLVFLPQATATITL